MATVPFGIFTLICVISGIHCVSFRGRILETRTLREEALARTRVRRDPASSQDHCSRLTAPWMEARAPAADWGHVYRLKICPLSRDAPRRVVFPEPPLFRFVRRVYRCCQKGYRCGSVKGLQGRDIGGSSIEFLLSEDVLSATVARAEIHLHISNPEKLNIQPLLPSLQKRQLPTRFGSWTEEGVMELRVDVMFVFQALQRVLGSRSGGNRLLNLRRVGGLSRPWALEPQDNSSALQDAAPAAWGQGSVDEWRERPLQALVELGLALHCSTARNTHPCESHGVRLLHTPFITLSYR